MNISGLHIFRSSVLCFGLLFAFSSFARAGVNVDNFDIAGYRLYMTEADALKVNPSLKLVAIKVQGDVVGYKAKDGPVTVYFSHEELGKKTFRIEHFSVSQNSPNMADIMDGIIKKYGKPDAMGRVMLHSQACWGTCIGQSKKLFLKIRIVQITNKPFPITLQLIDQKVEIANKKAFLKRTGRD